MASSLGLASVRSGSLESGGWRSRGAGRAQPSRLLIAWFAVFVSSLPFDAASTLGEGFFSISRLLIYVLFGLAVLQPRVCFRKPPRAIWWFALSVVVFALSGLFQPPLFRPAIYAAILRFTQFLVLLWLGYNLFQYERVVRWCLWGYGLSSVAVAGLLVGGIGATQLGAVGRETVFGQPPNSLAAKVAFGALTLIGMAYGRATASRMTKLAVWGGFVVVAVAVAHTGSRGALVAMGAGLMMLLLSRGSARTRMRNAVIVLLALVVCYGVTIAYAPATGRWQATLEEGNMSGRLPIFLSASRMVEERPMLGWGPVTNIYELGRRVNTPTRDTHNLFLWLLTQVGLVGTIPFCIGLALCVRAAWRGRRSTQGPLPLALMAASLTVNLSATHYEVKVFWVFLAYSLASETYLRVRRARWTERSSKGLGLTRLLAPARREVV